MDLRDEFIARVAPGQSFADIGGLWGTVNEKVSVAAQSGARNLTMMDISQREHPLWHLFRERLASLGIQDFKCISSDVCVFASRRAAPKFDVVHCSGVLYHHPSPVLLLAALRRVTVRHLILTSAVTQEEIVNDLGELHVPASGAIFVPALDTQEREIVWKYWRENSGSAACYGISEPAKWNPRDFGPWWWLFTPRVMLAMAESVGFRVLESGPVWNGNAHTALLEAVE